jgi:hypothetical protein
MITKEISASMKQAWQDLLKAEAELNRPLEDVVTLSACRSVRNSMKQMMQLYLSAHAVKSQNESSLDDLHKLCIKSNKSFGDIDFGSIECKGMDHATCDGKYCLGVENVASCLMAANQLRDLIWWELKLTN